MKKLRILLDCDGVLSDYCTACFDLIEKHTGDRHTHEEVTHWDVFEVLGKGHLKAQLKEEQAKPGWCMNFPRLFGAQNFVEALSQIGEVVIVTSPMSTPHWADERRIWLEQHFGIPKKRVISTEGKHYVEGDVLIDDSDDHCRNWLEEYPEKLALLWDAPYNRKVDLAGTKIIRVKDASQALGAIDSAVARGLKRR